MDHPFLLARVVTFGKAIGCHGATVLGRTDLKDYLINFCKPFIYTTGLSPHSVATIMASHQSFSPTETNKLYENIQYFKKVVEEYKLAHQFLASTTAIQGLLVGSNDKTKKLSNSLQELGFAVKPILSPTVSVGTERIRICLHSFNTKEEIKELILRISEYLN